MARDGDRYTLPSRAPAPFMPLIIPEGVGAPSRPLPQRLWVGFNTALSKAQTSRLVRFVIPTALLLRDCFGDDLTYFFVAEWRAEDVHADIGSDSPQLGHVSRKKAPPLDILEKAFETAGGKRHREADALGTISPPSVRTELRQKNQITGPKNEGKIRRPNDCLAFDQFKNLILSVMKMPRRPKAGRSAIIKNGKLPPAVGGANPDARLLAPRRPRHKAR